MLIIDLDDTIFHTQSMDPKIFDSAISVIKNYYHSNELIVKGNELIAELWLRPTDDVFSEYGTPKEIVAKFYQAIAKIDFNELDIQAFDDYKAIASIALSKVLVTTGLRELQWAKIKALGIESDFEAIYIDDPRDQPRRHKINIFKQILEETQKAPEEIWIIGDNPESEIKAGKALKMNTIQRKSPSKPSSKYADYEIDTFEELKKIIK